MTNDKFISSLPNVISLLLIILIAANYFGTFADLDWAWQIRTGQEIITLETLRPPETFSYTIAGTSVPDFEWLYEVILYLLWDYFGYGALKFLRVVLVAAPLVIVGLRLRREGVRWHGIALAMFAAIFVLAPAWNLRPMYCTTIGLLLVSGWLHDHCTGRRPSPPPGPLLVRGGQGGWLPVVMLLWGNLHPGVITGQGLLAGAIAWEWLNRAVKLNTPLTIPELKRLTLIGGLGLLATFISPYPLERLLYPFQPQLAHPIQRIFVEMQPTYTFIATPPYSTGLAYLVALLVMVTLVMRFRHYRLWEVALLAGTAGLANIAFRSLQDWLLIMLSLSVPHLVIVFAQAARARPRRWWVRLLLRADRLVKKVLFSRWMRFQPAWPLLAAGLLLVVSLIPPLSRPMPMQNSGEWPVAAVNYIKQAGLKGNFFAPSDYGAYLIWRLPGQAKVYTDTRGFFYPPVLLEDSHYVPLLWSDWETRLKRILKEYPTDYFLLETTRARGALWRLLQPHLGQPMFLDETTVLLEASQVRKYMISCEPQGSAAAGLARDVQIPGLKGRESLAFISTVSRIGIKGLRNQGSRWGVLTEKLAHRYDDQGSEGLRE